MSNKPMAAPEHVCVKDMKAGDTLLQFFRIMSRDLRKTRSGQNYLDLTLSDATGSVSGKMWADAIRKWGQEFNPGDFVKVEGTVETYRDRQQIVVEKIRSVTADEIPDPAVLVRSSSHDPELLFQELRDTAGTLEPPELSELMTYILDLHADALKTYPAARMIHHAYRGGLIEHVVAVTKKVEAILCLEPNINRGTAIAGAILHDIGKTRELSPSGQGRTVEGRLVGHIVQGVSLLREAALERGVTGASWLTELEHIIVSHHGEPEFGAAVRPLTREALLIHYLDNLDAKLRIVDEALESADAEGFAPYNRWLEGRAFAGSSSRAEEEEDDVGNPGKTG